MQIELLHELKSHLMKQVETDFRNAALYSGDSIAVHQRMSGRIEGILNCIDYIGDFEKLVRKRLGEKA